MKKATFVFLACAGFVLCVSGIDLEGVSRTVGSGEYAEEFTNSSETLAELAFDAQEAVTFTGKISGNVKLVKRGGGSLELKQANSFTGGTALEAGSLKFTVEGALGSGLVTISSGAELRLEAAVVCANPIHLLATGSKVVSANGSGSFDGDITGERGITFTPTHKGKVDATFNGDITIEDGILKAYQKQQQIYTKFYGRVQVKKVDGMNGSGHVSGLSFFKSGNVWDSFTFRRYNAQCEEPYFAAGAIPEGSYIDCKNRNTTSYGFSFSGDQTFKYITFTTPSKGAAIVNATTASSSHSVLTLGSEVEETGSQSGFAYVFKGPMDLVYAPANDGSKWLISAGESTMTGALKVRKGIFAIEKTATFKKAVSLEVGAGAIFDMGDSTNALAGVASVSVGAGSILKAGSAIDPFLDGKVAFDVASDGCIEIPADMALSCASFAVADKKVQGGVFYTGADNPSPGESVPLAQLSGNGKIYVPVTIDGETSSSIGSSGGDVRLSSAADWNGGVLPDMESGSLLASFVSAGTNVIVDGSYVFRGLSLSAPEGKLSLSADPAVPGAQVALFCDGISIASPAADETKSYRLAVPVKILSNQLWEVPEGTGLDIAGPVVSPVGFDLHKTGAGDLNIYSTNSFAGNFVISNGAVNVHTLSNAFGSGSGTVTLRQDLGASIHIHTNTVIEKDFVFNNKKDKSGWTSMDSGLTCTFLGYFTSKPNWRPAFGRGAEVVFANGGWFDSYFIVGNGTVRFKGAPFRFGTGFNLQGGRMEFEVGDNDFTGNFTVNGGGHVVLLAENVFESGTSVTLGNNNNSECSLTLKNGCAQQMGKLALNTATSVVTADEPAVLKVNQGSDVTWHGSFQGELSLEKTGAGIATVYRAMPSNGDLSVLEGGIVFGENGSWKGAQNVTLENASISVAASGTFSKEAILHTSGEAVLDLASGATVKFAGWMHEGVRRPNGIYTAANSDGMVTGEGICIVGDTGTIMVIR